MIRKYSLYGLIILKFIQTCFKQRIWYVLENVPFAVEKNIYFALLLDEVFYKCQIGLMIILHNFDNDNFDNFA